MNIEQAENKVQKAFQQAIKSADFAGALAVLCAHECTVRPSQAPELKSAVRQSPTLLTSGELVQRANGGKVEVTARCLEPDRDLRYPEIITEDWLTDVRTVEDDYPHFSETPTSEYRVTHFARMGQWVDAISALQQFGVSFHRDDFEGALQREVLNHFNTMGGAERRARVVEDARSIAIKGAE